MEIKGDASKRRFFAANFDALLALAAGLLIASSLPGAHPYVRGTILCLSYLAYFIVCEALWGRTLFKRLFGLHVVQLDGRPCTGGQAVTRGLVRVLDANPFFLGGLPAVGFALLTPKHQRLGDLLAGTVVARTEIQKERVDPASVTAFE
jgi:uncharacterized RDD family membrane protein YckC